MWEPIHWKSKGTLKVSFSRPSSIAGNVANYLKLLEVDSLYLPVPVNFIFIGFEGKGNHGMKCSWMWTCLRVGLLTLVWSCYMDDLRGLFLLEFKLHPEELERWFIKLDHIFEHTRIPQVREVLTPFYKMSMDKVLRHQLPLISHTNYK